MKEVGEKVLLTMAIIAVAVSVVATGITYFSISDLSLKLTALVTSATANLTVETLASVNFSVNNLSWGSGRVTNGFSAALLNTYPIDNVTGGNWTLRIPGGLRIVNLGNVNVSLNLTGTKTAAQFIGGTNPTYKWNVTEAETGSCVNSSGHTQADGTNFADFLMNLNYDHNVNTTADTDAQKCFALRFEEANDEMRIDFNLTIPEDSSTGALTDTITATIIAQNPE